MSEEIIVPTLRCPTCIYRKQINGKFVCTNDKLHVVKRGVCSEWEWVGDKQEAPR